MLVGEVCRINSIEGKSENGRSWKLISLLASAWGTPRRSDYEVGVLA